MVRQFKFHDSSERSGRSRLLYATLLILLLFFLDLISGGAVRNLVRSAASSVWAASAGLQRTVLDSGFFASRRALTDEIEMLRAQLQQNSEKAAAYEVVASENELLRSLLSLSQQERGVTVPVVSSVRSSPYGTFVVGAGRDAGITAGSLVLSEGGFVVGRVSEVQKNSSLVSEILAGGARIDVMISGAVASASGRGGGNARVGMPRAISISVGEPVTAPELRGRAVGLVGSVESDSASAEQTVYFSLPVNLASLRYVYIVPIQ